jgi:hypothetical protein
MIKINRPFLKLMMAVGFLLLFALPVAAKGKGTRSYQLPGHGHFQILVPESWQEEVNKPGSGLPPTILFSPKSGEEFKVFITPIYAARPDIDMPKPETIRSIVEKAAQNAEIIAVEKTVPVMELKGPAVTGYYFSATDQAPAEGEYKHLTQGMCRVGDLAPTFTILTNDDTGKVVAESLSVLKSARQVE